MSFAKLVKEEYSGLESELVEEEANVRERDLRVRSKRRWLSQPGVGYVVKCTEYVFGART